MQKFRKLAIHSSAFVKYFPDTPKGNLLDVDSLQDNTASPFQFSYFRELGY